MPPQVGAPVQSAVSSVSGPNAQSATKATGGLSDVGLQKSAMDKARESMASDTAASTVQSSSAQPNIQSPQAQAPISQTNVANLLKLIAETVQKITVGETETTIQLKQTDGIPGDVQLHVQLNNGALEVRIDASDSRAAEVLANNMAGLQGALSGVSQGKSVSISINDNRGADEPGRASDERGGVSSNANSGQPRVAAKGGAR